ncbi:putative molybdenum carrier [Legionella rubrilucens]|uniref:Putative molybdenum carrier n=1 Tax=Legionella rubrilucens TaxID=458 RepID=A0A0W0XZ85_9GAMM|nr:putative molybdenum carrier protein [Legionella rubrilucens]KTD49587.1 putative molybdenum carrier [Legionella rubrilucens]
MIKKIVSGRQTGAAQAALLVATEMGIEIGGWCHKGGIDENGVNVLKQFPALKEATPNDPDERTKLNIRDYDGIPSWPLPEKINDGTKLTIEDADIQKKPRLIASLDSQHGAVQIIKAWISENDIRVLNIDGPRESNSPGIYRRLGGFFTVCLKLYNFS